jgi:DNA polymerase III delta prime subunit
MDWTRKESEVDKETGFSYWTKAEDCRHPWARRETLDELRAWIAEAEHADVLREAGEKIYPLLLSGPTRCGKTSTMCWLAKSYFDVPSYRVNLASIIAPHMGETTRNMRAALTEAMHGPTALWIMDEVDGLFPQRKRDGGGGATNEMNAAMSVALTIIEALPQHLMLVGTTNEADIIDKAMLARFRHVSFPRWEELDDSERRGFAKSHQLEDAWSARSYADVVQMARDFRVKKILAKAKDKEAEAEKPEEAAKSTDPGRLLKKRPTKSNPNGVDDTVPPDQAF